MLVTTILPPSPEAQTPSQAAPVHDVPPAEHSQPAASASAWPALALAKPNQLSRAVALQSAPPPLPHASEGAPTCLPCTRASAAQCHFPAALRPHASFGNRTFSATSRNALSPDTLKLRCQLGHGSLSFWHAGPGTCIEWRVHEQSRTPSKQLVSSIQSTAHAVRAAPSATAALAPYAAGAAAIMGLASISGHLRLGCSTSAYDVACRHAACLCTILCPQYGAQYTAWPGQQPHPGQQLHAMPYTNGQLPSMAYPPSQLPTS